MTAGAPEQPAPATSGGRPARGRADLRSLARGGSINIAGAATTAVANVVLVVIVTRGFHQATAGVFFAATSVFLLGSAVAKLGTETGLVYFIARFRALGTPERLQRCLGVALPPVVGAALVIGAVLYVAAPEVARLAVRGGPGDFVTYLRALAVALPVAAFSDACLAATRGFGTMRPTALADNIGRPLGQLALTVAVAVAGSGALLTVAWAGPYLPTAVVAWLWLTLLRRRHAAAVRAAPVPPRAVLARDFWRYSAPRAFAGVAQLALQRLDVILVASLRGPVEAAVYAAATRFLVVGQLGARAISEAVQPQLGTLLAHENRTETNKAYQISTSWLVLITWPMYLLFAVFSGYVLRVFGDGYDAGAPVIVILALAMLVATVCGMVDMVLNMAGRTTWALANILLALGVNVGLDLILIPRHGILGAAVGWAMALVVKNVVPLAQVALALRLHPFGAGTLRAVVLAGLCFGVLPLAVRAVAGDGLIPLSSAAALGVALYGYGCWRCRDVLRLRALRALRPGSTRAHP